MRAFRAAGLTCTDDPDKAWSRHLAVLYAGPGRVFVTGDGLDRAADVARGLEYPVERRDGRLVVG